MKALLTALAFVVAAAAQNAVQLPSVYQAQNPSPNAPGGYCQTQSPPTYNYATNTLFSCVPNTTPPTDRGTWTPSTFAVLPQLVTVAPSGACTGQGLQYVKPGGTVYTCQSGTWLQLAGTGAVSAVTASAPFTSSGGSAPNISATVQGNGSKVQLSTGTTTTNDCVKFDANGNTVDAGSACSAGSGITALTGDVTASGTGSVAATVVKVNGVTVTGTPSSGQVITATGATAASWQAPTVASTLPFAVSFATNVVTSGISNPSGFIGVLPGNGPPIVTGVATLTITSGTGTIFEYISGGTGGTVLGVHTFAHNITVTSCTNCTAVSGTSFPIDSFPIRTITVTSGTASLLASYVTGSYSWQPLLPGSNVALTPSNGSITVSATVPASPTLSSGWFYPFEQTLATANQTSLNQSANVVACWDIVWPFSETPTTTRFLQYGATNPSNLAWAIYDSTGAKLFQTATYAGTASSNAIGAAAWTSPSALSAVTQYTLCYTSDGNTAAVIAQDVGNLGVMRAGSPPSAYTAANASTGTTTLTFPATLGAKTGANPGNPVLAIIK